MSNHDLVELPFQPTIKINDFEGPLDLLLHLIRQSKMDIYDIRIAEITDQYMKFLADTKKHRLEIAGEYFVMAATLMAIKSQMLLPKPPQDEEEAPEEQEDPREELVEQLLEYQRYKDAATHLKSREEERQKEYTREAMAVPKGLVHEHVAPGVTIDQLQVAFVKILKKRASDHVEIDNVEPEKVTVAERIAAVKKMVTKPVRFVDLFANDRSRDNLVTTFMAVLELVRHQVIWVNQTELFGPLVVVPGPKQKVEENE